MALEFVRVGGGTAVRPIANFFLSMEKSGDVKFFHPHPITEEEAVKRCSYDGKDLYYVATNEGTVLAYGMLRGWDEGYAIPSLGIFVHQSARGTDLARAFMLFLHAAAKAHGAEKVMLKVYPQNLFAVRLYENVGYKFSEKVAGQLVGYVKLKTQGKAESRESRRDEPAIAPTVELKDKVKSAGEMSKKSESF